jgi:E3 ubiquitin-protein ligase TRIP12
VKNRQL